MQRKKRLHYQEIVDFGVYTYTDQKLIHGFYQYIYFREALATTKATITSSPRQVIDTSSTPFEMIERLHLSEAS